MIIIIIKRNNINSNINSNSTINSNNKDSNNNVLTITIVDDVIPIAIVTMIFTLIII